MIDPSNPFAAESELPYHLPDFAAIEPRHYREAVDAGMADELAELEAIAQNPEPATVENVLDAWERSGRLLDRALTAFYAVKACDTNNELDAIQAEYAPRLSEHSDSIYMNRRLFDRFTELAGRADAGEVELDAQASWLLQWVLGSFTRSGVALSEAEQTRLRELNQTLAQLGTRFEKANLAARNAAAVVVDDEAQLAGLSEEEKASLARDGHWVIDQVNTSQHPLLTKLADRGLRRRVYEASVSRALSGEADTRQIIVDIARARAERATLLGYPNHAAYVVERTCAKTSEAVNDLLAQLGPAARAQAQRDAVEIEQRLQQIEPGASLEPWDWGYVAEQIREERYDLNLDELRPYLGVQKVLDAVYGAATRLYGITFSERPELRGHTDDAVVYEVADADGEPIGLFIMDFWSRPSKQGGAWMNSIVNQSHLLGTRPVVTNNCNYSRGTSSISWDGVQTMFHEFGHALHGLFATVTFPHFAGTAVFRDFVEFPSQVNEMWILWPEVLSSYARHIDTGEPLPADVVARLHASEAFNQGFATSEYLAAAWLDQAWHGVNVKEADAVTDVAAFEAAALADIGLHNPVVPTRYSSTYFAHVFSGGYSAGYYSYIWSEVLDADTVEWFAENGGLTRAGGDRFRDRVLGVGGSKDPLEAYRDFRGRDADIAPLLVRRGLGS